MIVKKTLRKKKTGRGIIPVENIKGILLKTKKKKICAYTKEGADSTEGSCFTYNHFKNLYEAIIKKPFHIQVNDENKNEIINLNDNVIKTAYEEIKNFLRNKYGNSCSSGETTEELCWINNLRETHFTENQFSELKKLFLPHQPKGWKHYFNIIKNNRKPMTTDEEQIWLSNYNINDVLKPYEKKYHCFRFFYTTMIDYNHPSVRTNSKNDLFNFTLSTDKLNNKKNFGVVLNMDEHTKEGSHWVSLFFKIIIDNVTKKRRFIAFFYNSLGSTLSQKENYRQLIPKQIKDFINKTLKNQLIKHYKFSPSLKYDFSTEMDKELSFKEIQEMTVQNIAGTNDTLEIYYNYHTHQLENTECGMYSIFFIVVMLTRFVPSSNIKLSIDQVLELFLTGNINGKKFVLDDEFIKEYRNYFYR